MSSIPCNVRDFLQGQWTFEDREEVKIVKKAAALQNKAGPKRKEVLWKRTEAAAGKMQRAAKKTVLEWAPQGMFKMWSLAGQGDDR